MRRWHISFRFTRIGLDQISAAGVQLRKSEREIVKHKGRELHLQTWALRSHWRFAVHAESTHGIAASTANDCQMIMRVKSFDKAVSSCLHAFILHERYVHYFNHEKIFTDLTCKVCCASIRILKFDSQIDRFCILSMLRGIELSFDVQRSRSVIQPKMEKGLSSWP